MGYSNETTHYGIPLPTGSDLTTPMDYNEAMTDVDVAVFEAKTDSDSALTKAGQLEVALGQTNDAVSGIDGRLTEAEGTISSQGLAITNLRNDVGDLGRDVEDAMCSVVEETATAEYVHEVGDYFWYNNTLYITTAYIDIGNQIVPNTNCNTVTIATELNRIEADERVKTVTISKQGKTVGQGLNAIATTLNNLNEGQLDSAVLDIENFRLRFTRAGVSDNYEFDGFVASLNRAVLVQAQVALNGVDSILLAVSCNTDNTNTSTLMTSQAMTTDLVLTYR